MVYGKWIRYDIYDIILVDNSNGDSHGVSLWILYEMPI